MTMMNPVYRRVVGRERTASSTAYPLLLLHNGGERNRDGKKEKKRVEVII